jgi:hypothetical protein
VVALRSVSTRDSDHRVGALGGPSPLTVVPIPGVRVAVPVMPGQTWETTIVPSRTTMAVSLG